MKSLKFRAWHKELKIMTKGFDLTSLTADYGGTVCLPFIESRFNEISINDENIELMQWTGLQDKHGKDIYEGDVLEWVGYDYDENHIRIESNKRGDVVYCGGHPKVHYFGQFNLWKTADEPDADYYFYLDYLESGNNATGSDFYKNPRVIGNIYETPELLKCDEE